MTSKSDKPVVLIYRSRLLPASETFIQAQAAAMITYQPFFVGVIRVNGLTLSPESSFTATDGQRSPTLQEIRARLLGPSSEMIKTLKALEPQLIHAHFGPDACEALPLSARLKLPLVVTFHGYDATTTDSYFRRSRHGLLYLARRAALRNSSARFIAVSNFVRQKMIEQRYPADRIRMHSVGIDTEFFRPSPDTVRKPVVLFVARLVEKKGGSYLIRAMQRVQEQLPHVELVVIGDGPLRAQLEKEAGRNLKRYRFLGRLDSTAVREWMQQSMIFCVPSVTAPSGDAEGFGMVFAEAQACGLPVVSFASGGISEAVEHEVSGLLAPEGNWEKLAEYMTLLLSDQKRWTLLSNAGRSRVEKHFEIHSQTRALEEIYTETIAAAGAE